MPRKKIKLTFFLMISCLGIALIPVLIYSFLSFFVFGQGLDTINKRNLIKSIYSYAKNHDKYTYENNTKTDKINVVLNYSNIPEKIKNMFPKSIDNNILYKQGIKSEYGELKEICLLISIIVSGKRYFAYQIIPSFDAEEYILPQIIQTIHILIGAAVIIMVILFIFIKYLIKKISYPIYVLSSWSNNLSIKNINSSLPNLEYPELYDIARLLQNNLMREYSYIQNEEIFWRYCSHELRTPISVIRVGVELLQKKVNSNIFDHEQYNIILRRLRRSSHSMSSIIETILWISRPNENLSRQEINLSTIIDDIIQDFKRIYFIENCNLKINISSYKMIQPVLAVRMVLENLIRNAFQHSIGDEICIVQYKNNVKIINELIPENDLVENTGFGLGLELIKRLTCRLNWQFKILKNDKYNIVSVVFK